MRIKNFKLFESMDHDDFISFLESSEEGKDLISAFKEYVENPDDPIIGTQIRIDKLGRVQIGSIDNPDYLKFSGREITYRHGKIKFLDIPHDKKYADPKKLIREIWANLINKSPSTITNDFYYINRSGNPNIKEDLIKNILSDITVGSGLTSTEINDKIVKDKWGFNYHEIFVSDRVQKFIDTLKLFSIDIEKRVKGKKQNLDTLSLIINITGLEKPLKHTIGSYIDVDDREKGLDYCISEYLKNVVELSNLKIESLSSMDDTEKLLFKIYFNAAFESQFGKNIDQSISSAIMKQPKPFQIIDIIKKKSPEFYKRIQGVIGDSAEDAALLGELGF